MAFSQINEDSIALLMDIFYGKIRADKQGLGDIFNNTIGRDDEKWKAHKAKIARFWESMLLGASNYSGQPMKAHLDLPPFPREFFNIWLGLFEESLKEVYDNQTCIDTILARAFGIAQRFQFMLYESGHK